MIDKEKLEDAYKKRDCFFEAIENGDLDKVKSMLPYVKKVLKSGEMGLLKRVYKDSLRSLKNIMLSYNSLYFLFAQKGGMDSLTSHYLAENYAIIIEGASKEENVWEIHDEMVYKYTDPKNRQRLSEKSLAQRVNKLLNVNFMYPITIDDLANELNVSKEHMMRKYKEKYKKTILQDLQEIRIEEGKKFLKHTDLKVIDIAFSVGYNSSQYFSKVFKTFTGLSPNEFKKMQNKSH